MHFILLDSAQHPGFTFLMWQDGEDLRQQASEEDQHQSRVGAAWPRAERNQRLFFPRHGKPSAHFLYGRPHTVKEEPLLAFVLQLPSWLRVPPKPCRSSPQGIQHVRHEQGPHVGDVHQVSSVVTPKFYSCIAKVSNSGQWCHNIWLTRRCNIPD